MCGNVKTNPNTIILEDLEKRHEQINSVAVMVESAALPKTTRLTDARVYNENGKTIPCLG